ncbi:MAG: CDP-alcohol phosphatidyltransferase family protein [Roseiflexaceae bacterium]|jgi:phosphatidylcholine synthase
MSSLRVKAFLVHAYTASTVILQLLSVDLLLRDQINLALVVMLMAVAIDATDGFLARRYRVKEIVPEFDGRRLDDIVDYISYVFLPVIIMLKAGMLLQPAVLFGSLPLLASAFGFSRVDAKLDDDGFFLGFPSYWNVVVVYLYMFGLPVWINTAIIVFLSVMVFVPTRYIYITRFHSHPRLHFLGALICSAALLVALLVEEPLRRPLLFFSILYPIYYTILSFVADWRARRAAG